MISSVNSMSSMVPTMRSDTTRQPPPPPDKDVFKIADSDGDGLVAGTELESIIEAIGETTGISMTVDDALASFDTDGDNGLSGEELLELLKDSGFSPPDGQNSEAGPPPPPPPSMEQALASYSQNSGEDLIQQLIDRLQGNDSSETVSSAINVAG